MNRLLGYAIRPFECLERLSRTLTTQPIYSTQLFVSNVWQAGSELAFRPVLSSWNTTSCQQNQTTTQLWSWCWDIRHILAHTDTGCRQGCTRPAASPRGLLINGKMIQGWTSLSTSAEQRWVVRVVPASFTLFHPLFFFSVRHLKHPEGALYYGTPRSLAKSDMSARPLPWPSWSQRGYRGSRSCAPLRLPGETEAKWFCSSSLYTTTSATSCSPR